MKALLRVAVNGIPYASVRAGVGSPALLTKPIAAALGQVHGDIAITFRPLMEHVNAAVAQERLLAALGLYGVTSYAVNRRWREIGVRIALGAAPSGVVRLILQRVALLVSVGIVLGMAGSVWASQFVSTLLFGLQPGDPTTLIGSILVLAMIGALAGWLPARRAARIDPAEVLRDGSHVSGVGLFMRDQHGDDVLEPSSGRPHWSGNAPSTSRGRNGAGV